jgi:hypothetical protein
MPDTKYPFILTTIAVRREDVTPAEFQRHNEEFYVPLMQKLAGKVHPLKWVRRYHVDDSEIPLGMPRVMLGGEECLNWVDWTCFGEMTFEDELHCQQFLAFIQSDDAVPLVEEEEKFVDAEKTKVILMKRTVSTRLE